VIRAIGLQEDGTRLDGPRRRPTVPRVESMLVERLSARLDAIWEHRLGVVVAPPGSGKTTMMARFVESIDDPVAWVCCDKWDARPATLCSQLGAALEPWTGACTSDCVDMEAVIAGLERWDPERALIVIDDLHALDGSGAMDCLERMLDHLPDGVHLLVASRTQPALNLSRLRLSESLLEIDADDLRLRTWEVERLFRDHYGEPMAPEDLARLAWWTHGWAAGLQLFHLATQGRPADERRRVLGSLGPRSHFARQYLAQNALDRVPHALRSFMVETSVSSRLNGRLCDRLLSRTGSDQVLDELEQRCLFTTRVNDSDDYRYHEVFRSHLQGVLMSEVGEDGARARFVTAGHILLEEGTAAEALEAFVRGEAWETVERVLAEQGPAIAEEPLRWLGVQATEPLGDDPWLALAGARRLRAEGRFIEAEKAYAAISVDARQVEAAAAAGREGTALRLWLQPGPGRAARPDSGWAGLRQTLSGRPTDIGEVARGDVEGQLAVALSCLAKGDLVAADRHAVIVEADAEVEGVTPCIAAMVRGVIALLEGDESGLVGLNGAIGAAEGQGLDWLARIGGALTALSGRSDHLHEAARLEDAARTLGDPWGAALACLSRAWGATIAAGHATALSEPLEPVLAAESARRQFRVLDAPMLEAWSASVAVLGRAVTSADGPIGTSALDSFTDDIEAEVPRLLARTAVALAGGDGDERQVLVDRLRRLGWRAPLPEGARPAQPARDARPGVVAAEPAATAPGPPARLRLFGTFSLEIGGEAADYQAIRPRVRNLLYLLALQADRPVHRETIMEALWPGFDPSASARNLYVAVATLRRVLEPGVSRGGFRLVQHDGDGYRLALPPGSLIDALAFEAASVAARTALNHGRPDDVVYWCRTALEQNRGELIPEAGPAEWIDGPRESYRLEAVELATMLAGTLSRLGEYEAAAAACVQGLERDRYHDPLWHILIDARDACGDIAAANAARSRYRRALTDMGCLATDGGGGG